MPRYIIKCVGWMILSPCPIEGEYLERVEFEVPVTEQMSWWTRDPEKAMAFPDFGAAYAAWKAERHFDGLRPDGRPDRPLTAFTVEIFDIDREPANGPR